MNLKAIRIEILYPDRKEVSAEQIVKWALDAFASQDISMKPSCLADAICALEDAGLVAFTKSIDALLAQPGAYELFEEEK